MIFTYTRKKAAYYDNARDEYFYDEYDFDFRVDDDKVLNALADILIGESNIETNNSTLKRDLEMVKRIIKNSGTQETLEERYEDELKDYFEEEAIYSEVGD